MPLNILEMRVAEVSDLLVKRADGSPMIDPDTNEPVTATVFGPATKIWQAANAAMRRKAIKRTREANGKIEAALDMEDEDRFEFLVAITKRFNGLAVPGVDGDKATVEAVYNDPLLGFIRDHMADDTRNWENFTKASRGTANSGPGNAPG